MISTKRLFGTNGIRGLVNKELAPEITIRIGKAIGTFFQRGTLIVGFDARTSGPMLSRAVISGLNSTGCNVMMAGMAPTPSLQYAIRNHKLDGGVIVTASHNPPEYNGIKVIWKDGVEVSHEQETQIEDIFFGNKSKPVEWNKIGTATDLLGINKEYVEGIKRHVDTKRVATRNYHVVIDAANSVGSLAAPYLLRDLGCKVTTINANIDGTFPGRLPEPRPENLEELATIVRAVHANLGVAFDGDADRSVFIDETGRISWGDATFALVEKHFLKKNRGERIVTPVSSSSIVKETAEQFGGKLEWTKVGSVTVSQTMKKTKAKLGGEENGGIFYGPHQAVRDGAMSTALILGIMAETNMKLSALLGELPKYYIEKGKIECPEELKTKTLERLIKEVNEKNVSTIDGIKIWFEDKSAILIRPSGTEPIYRLYAEAKTQRRAKQLVRDYLAETGRIIKSLKN